MNQSTEVKDLYAAFAAAQAEFVNVKADEKARVQTKSGGSFEYSYAGLGSYLSLVRPILAKFKLFTMQGVEIKQHSNGWVLELETRVGHESGQWQSSTSMFPVPNDPQQAGSVISYLRRYTLAAFLGLATEDDDGASGKGGNRAGTPRRADPPQNGNGASNGSAHTDAPVATVPLKAETPKAEAPSSPVSPTAPVTPPGDGATLNWGQVMTLATTWKMGNRLGEIKKMKDTGKTPEDALKWLQGEREKLQLA